MKKVILGFIIGILVCGVVGVSAYTLLAKDVAYKDTNVEAALNDLYDKTDIVYEEGTYSSYIEYSGHYICTTITLQNTYTESDNARILFTSITPVGAVYVYQSLAMKVVGNTYDFCAFNMSGTASYSQTYTFNYKIIRFE